MQCNRVYDIHSTQTLRSSLKHCTISEVKDEDGVTNVECCDQRFDDCVDTSGGVGYQHYVRWFSICSKIHTNSFDTRIHCTWLFMYPNIYMPVCIVKLYT